MADNDDSIRYVHNSKYEDEPDGRQELYNLKNDIEESENLAGRMPEKAAEMKTRLDAMLKEHGAKIPSPDPNYNGNSEDN